VPFILSNIESLIVLLVAIYYTLNPCLLSLPLVAFTFCYYSIATRKHIFLMVIYIFLLILATEFLQIYVKNYNYASDQAIKFLFATNSEDNLIYYNQPYLFFLFVVIFLSQ